MRKKDILLTALLEGSVRNEIHYHTDKCVTSDDLVFINQPVKRSSQPYIFIVRIYVKSSPVLLILSGSTSVRFHEVPDNIRCHCQKTFLLLALLLPKPFCSCLRTILGFRKQKIKLCLKLYFESNNDYKPSMHIQ